MLGCLKRNKQLMQTMLNPYCSVNSSGLATATAGQYNNTHFISSVATHDA